jgi:DHA1 family inner membrane transport protein
VTVGIASRHRWGLLSLTLGYFTLGTTLNSVVGIVHPLAADLHVPPARIALLVTMFAVIYAIAAPAVQLAGGRIGRRSLLLAGLAIVAAGGLLCAEAHTFAVLMAGRALAAFGSAVFGPVALASGTLLAPAQHQGRALGTVFGGMSIANVAGVPLVSWLSSVVGWRPALAGVAMLAVVAAAPIALLIPRLPAAGRIRPTAYIHVLKTPGVLVTILATGVWMAASYSIFSLASAYLTARFHADQSAVAIALFVYGIAGITGNGLATRFTDRLGPVRLVRLAQLAFGTALTMMLTLPAAPGFAIVMVIAWGVATQMFHPPQQSRLVDLVPDHRAIVLAVNSAAVYVGVSVGSAAGGAIFGVAGAGWLPGPAVVLLIGSVVAIELPRRAAARSDRGRIRPPMTAG